MHTRVSTSTIRLVGPTLMELATRVDPRPAYKGELRVTHPKWHTAIETYFPNWNFTTGMPESVPHARWLEPSDG